MVIGRGRWWTTTMVVVRTQVRARHRAETRGFEAFSAALLGGVWCVFLMWGGDTFGSTRAFAPLAELGSEQVWAIVMGVIGLVQAGGLALNRLRVRLAGTILAMSAYGALAWLFWKGNPGGTAWPSYVLLCAFNAWSLIRMR